MMLLLLVCHETKNLFSHCQKYKISSFLFVLILKSNSETPSDNFVAYLSALQPWSLMSALVWALVWISSDFKINESVLNGQFNCGILKMDLRYFEEKQKVYDKIIQYPIPIIKQLIHRLLKITISHSHSDMIYFPFKVVVLWLSWGGVWKSKSGTFLSCVCFGGAEL